MGVCESSEVRELVETQNKNNRDIEKQLGKKNSRQLEQQVLLLGPGESGKSTVMKQMKAMAGNYTKTELQEKKILILQNLSQFSHMLLDYVRSNCLELSDEDDRKYTDMSEKLKQSVRENGQLSSELAETIKSFWKSESIQEAYSKRDTFHLTDSAGYFFKSIDRIKQPNFEPSNQDIVHIRVPTSGVVQVDVILKNIKLTICDCGGQRSERKKWYHFFDDSNAILFVASLSDFDMKLAEDNTTNRMEEAVRLFWNVFNGKFFRTAAVILFLNKLDIFKEKVKQVNIKDHFPNFEGENTDTEGIKYFRQLFREKIHSDFKKRLYIHETCAISDQVQIILNSVIDTVVQNNLKDTGMI